MPMLALLERIAGLGKTRVELKLDLSSSMTAVCERLTRPAGLRKKGREVGVEREEDANLREFRKMVLDAS